MGYYGNTCHNNKLGLYLYTTARLNRLLFLLVCQAKLKKGEDNGHGKSYNSWLAWWRSTITTDDFLKFLSTQVTASQALVLVPFICGFVAYSFRFGVRFLALDLVGEFSVHMAKLFAIDCEELWSTHPGPVFDRSGIAAILWVAASLLTEPLLCP